jgi:putative transposase
LVFSTKPRRNTIPGELQEKLSMHFVGIGKGHELPVLCAGGTANHSHLISLPTRVSLAKAVQVLKANSARWLGEHGLDFAWQDGYGAFSVSSSNVEVVKHYIEHQAEHHAKHSFEDEFVFFVAQIRRVIRSAIRVRMRSDVPSLTGLGLKGSAYPALPCRAFAFRRLRGCTYPATRFRVLNR